jgi:hypothetical protein
MKTPSTVKSYFILIVFLGFFFAPDCFAAQQLSNPVTRYNITLDPAQDGAFLGWIELINGDKDAGYIYFENPPKPPHLSSQKTYIVMSFQPSFFETLLSILRSEKDVRISFFDCECAGGTPSAMIDSGKSIFVAQPGSLTRVNSEEVQHIKSMSKQP